MEATLKKGEQITPEMETRAKTLGGQLEALKAKNVNQGREMMHQAREFRQLKGALVGLTKGEINARDMRDLAQGAQMIGLGGLGDAMMRMMPVAFAAKMATDLIAAALEEQMKQRKAEWEVEQRLTGWRRQQQAQAGPTSVEQLAARKQAIDDEAEATRMARERVSAQGQAKARDLMRLVNPTYIPLNPRGAGETFENVKTDLRGMAGWALEHPMAAMQAQVTGNWQPYSEWLVQKETAHQLKVKDAEDSRREKQQKAHFQDQMNNPEVCLRYQADMRARAAAEAQHNSDYQGW